MEANKTVVRTFIEALGKGDVAGLKTVMAEDLVAICTGTSLLSGTRNYADICATAGMLAQAIPAGIQFTILSMTAEEDRVACEMQGQATLINGTPYNNQYHFLFVLRDGKVCRMKEYMDTKLADAALAPLFAAAKG